MLRRKKIEKELNTKTFGRNLYIFSEIDSTNKFARKLASQGAPEGTVVIADYQSDGKGRMGHEWLSDRSMNILMSLILRPVFNLESLHMITFTTMNIIISAIQMHLTDNNINNLHFSIKWPNDILVNNKKIAGILSESSLRNTEVEYVVTGIGLNVNQNVQNFNGELRNNSTSLYHETNKKFNREKIIIKILQQYEKIYYQLGKMIGQNNGCYV
jgi:BirA family biotin operon repressor/biotin-[acetyl-CoA-carboxylase] ligase